MSFSCFSCLILLSLILEFGALIVTFIKVFLHGTYIAYANAIMELTLITLFNFPVGLKKRVVK